MIYYCCRNCGIKHGSKSKGNDMPDFISTYHLGDCEICNKFTLVTSARDFGDLDIDEEEEDTIDDILSVAQ